MDRLFPTPEQIIIRAEGPDLDTDTYVSRIAALTAELGGLPHVASVHSITSDNAARSPLWRRLLLNSDGRATNLLLQVNDPYPAELVSSIEAVVERFDTADFSLDVSGIPYMIELIRRNLLRDLVVFSSAAFVIFGMLVGIVYRNWRIVLGMLTACLTACAVTLALTHILDISIGLLTANIAVIVFVLTLSHIVFLTANWKRSCQEPNGDGRDPVGDAVNVTIGASFWCMLTTFLGFLSLLVASARPLRELGIAGAIGAVTAIGIAYGVYPTFLRSVVPRDGDAPEPAAEGRMGTLLPKRNAKWWLITVAVTVFLASLGIGQITTDPGLLSYFAEDTKLRKGLEAIDGDGGSSPLNIAVRDTDGGRIDTDTMNEKMWTLQEALESDSSVGVVISPAVLLAHARLAPFAGLLNWSQLLDILESPLLDRVGLSFVTRDRQQARFFLRMRESGRTEARADVLARLRDHVRQSGLQVSLMGGHYELQGQLGRLIASSLRIGLGGLLLLFVAIAAIVSRSRRVTAAMVGCLCAIPLLVLGTMGHLGMSIDIIVSPAANVALAMGVDSMIHLVLRARRLASREGNRWQAWLTARAQLHQPVLSATFIICAGFGIFSLSTFPPTQRFGLAVILGTLTAATMALVALPFGAAAKLARD